MEGPWWRGESLILTIVIFMIVSRSAGSVDGGETSSDSTSIVNTTTQRQASTETKPKNIEGHVTSILQELQRLKEEHKNLSRRVSFLEMCDCQPKRCHDNGTTRNHGDRWTRGPCLTCQCHSGEITCVQSNSTRCQEPKDCEYEGDVHRDGDVFRPHYNPCLQCSCVSSRVSCVPRQCPPLQLPCQHPLPMSGQCCPAKCPECDYGGSLYQHGEEWSVGGCDTCRCDEGVVHCTSNYTCPPTSCSHGATPPGQCCPVCTDCVYEGERRKDGSLFSVGFGVKCQECACVSGQVMCQIIGSCTPVACYDPIQKQGRCCPMCRGCVVEGDTYEDGARMPSRQPCQDCRCNNGESACRPVACRRPACRSPVRVEGQCCPVCPTMCRHEGREYEQGHHVPSREPCSVCQCESGSVQCRRRPCPMVDCDYPHTPPGACCPTCNSHPPVICHYAGREYREGEAVHVEGRHCQQCHCQHGRIDCQYKTCPKVKCLYPVTENCCPSCHGCSFDDKTYRHSERFPDPRGLACAECTCHHGNVTCDRVKCDVTCTHPVDKPGECCPQCTDCYYDGNTHQTGSTFKSRSDPCLSCRCHYGSVTCDRQSCPPLPPPCQPLPPPPGHCCPVCGRDDGGGGSGGEGHCEYNGQRYREGREVDLGRDECEKCVCGDGRIRCHRVTCPETSCQHPAQGKCCSVCQGCHWYGTEYSNGQVFTHPSTGPCEECTCYYGTVQCTTKPCPGIRCSHPVPDLDPSTCCPICTDCELQGSHYRDVSFFPSPTNPCLTCQCLSGSITCRPQQCPPAPCRDPRLAQGACCPSCEDGPDRQTCVYGSRTFSNGQDVPVDRDECERCVCEKGEIRCSYVKCPDVTCQHPVQDGCCPSCKGCAWQGESMEEGESIPDPRDRDCHTCDCHRGTVTCSHVHCQPARCDHPAVTPGQCCPTCSDCSYENHLIPHGETISSRVDPCVQCLCSSGTVTCTRPPCPRLPCHTTLPPPPGQCCPVCDPSSPSTSCIYRGRSLEDGEVLPPQSGREECEVCRCLQGRISCSRVECGPVICSHPVQGLCCPSCTDCDFEGELVVHGDVIHPVSDPCSDCTCDSGSVRCHKWDCPPVNCTRLLPPPPGACCPTCAGCLYQGFQIEEGELWVDPGNSCSQCVCLEGSVSCSVRPCPPPLTTPCSPPPPPPLTTNLSHCCPPCRPITCLWLGREVQEGDILLDPDDPCLTCRCKNGELQCVAVVCPPLKCARTVKLFDECCPVCSDCDVGGLVYQDGETFPHFVDPCQTCLCSAGEVLCHTADCLPVDCSHPQLVDGCCLRCDGCNTLSGEVLNNNQRFSPEPCQSCLCQGGNLLCEPVVCPELTCPVKIEKEDQCCPECRGCEMAGVVHEVGSVWMMEENDCTLCQCHPTMAICSRVECLTPCINPLPPRPGYCCPACPGTSPAVSVCEFNGNIYNDGDSFSTTGSPCDVCTCNNGSLNCYMQKCDIKFLCPAEDYIEPLPGQCCGSCKTINTQCTLKDIGLVITPTEDPCFTCECTKENVLSCGVNSCPKLVCPRDDQVTVLDSCCPICAGCQIPSTGESLANGATWQSPLDPCFYCHCNLGDIVCEHMMCEPVVCPEGESLTERVQECCPQCHATEVVCKYGNLTYTIGEGWRVDECTDCFCDDNGEVSCRYEACPPLQCSPSEDPSVMPGQCCPICLAKPATCTVFGDPHYRTFDGSLVSFQGTCRYVMSVDCHGGTFKVEVSHDDRGTDGTVSWVDTLTLFLNGTRIDLLRRQKVTVNHTEVALPYIDPSTSVYIQNSGTGVLLYTTIGLVMSWDGESFGVLTVPGTYQGALCGLCGNFNGFTQDDLTTRTGVVVTSPATFGNSWTVNSNGTCSEALDIDTCAEAGYRIRKMANTKCAPIKGALFSACHKVVAPDAFFSACVYDLCACEDIENCQCDAFSAYAQACTKAGVKIHWRSEGLCAIGCVADLGFIFDECGPACPATCENIRFRKTEVTSSRCYKPCVPGCQCPAHLVLHQGRCIDERACPPIIHKEQLG